MAEGDNANPGIPQRNPNENQPDEAPFAREILEAIQNDLHGSKTMIKSIYGTNIE